MELLLLVLAVILVISGVLTLLNGGIILGAVLTIAGVLLYGGGRGRLR